MELFNSKEVLGYCSTFVNSLKDKHYKNVDVSFKIDSDYTDYDEMLKRNVVYTSFNVNESLCKCTIGFKNNSIEMHFSQNSFFSKPELITDSFLLFLEKHNLKITTDNMESNFRIKMHQFIGNVFLSKNSLNDFSFLSDAVQVIGNDFYENLTQFSQYMRLLLLEWLSHITNVTFSTTHEEINPGEISYVLSVSMLFSKIDIDCSTDIDHTIFRWQETSLFKNSTYTEKSLEDCIQILKENKLIEPADSVIAGIVKFEVDDNCNCLVLRYTHKIEDPDFVEITTNNSDKPIYRSAGYVVFENDFWEFYIDCSTRKVVSENRKWRTIGNTVKK